MAAGLSSRWATCRWAVAQSVAAAVGAPGYPCGSPTLSACPPAYLNFRARAEAHRGPLSGTFVTALGSYPVSGSWAASGSLPGRNASAFSFSGAAGGSATTFIAVVGIMIGPGPSPTQINLRVSESASTDGSLTESTATLLPTG